MSVWQFALADLGSTESQCASLSKTKGSHLLTARTPFPTWSPLPHPRGSPQGRDLDGDMG